MAKKVVIEGAHIWSKNFAGVAKKYNAEGNRNFCLDLDPELAQAMKDDGWNVKFPDPESDYLPYISVGVRFDKYPAHVFRHRSDGSVEEMKESHIALLDDAEIENIDIIIRPYEYDVRGQHGIKAYVDTMDITLAENPLDIKYGR